MIISRSQKTCPEIQLSELPLGPEMKRLSGVLYWAFVPLLVSKRALHREVRRDFLLILKGVPWVCGPTLA